MPFKLKKKKKKKVILQLISQICVWFFADCQIYQARTLSGLKLNMSVSSVISFSKHLVHLSFVRYSYGGINI